MHDHSITIERRYRGPLRSANGGYAAGVLEEGERCVVIGWPLGEEGRKLHAGTALVGDGGEVLARSRQLWIEPRPS